MKQPERRSPQYLMVAIALACTLAGFAVPSFAVAQPALLIAATEQDQRFSVSGTVVEVDYDANSVTINAGGKHVEVAITPTTAIDVRGQVGSIADIHRGRKIMASGVIHGGTMVAQSIKLR